MTFTLSYIVIGVLLIVMALAGSVLKRLPLTATLLALSYRVALLTFLQDEPEVKFLILRLRFVPN